MQSASRRWTWSSREVLVGAVAVAALRRICERLCGDNWTCALSAEVRKKGAGNDVYREVGIGAASTVAAGGLAVEVQTRHTCGPPCALPPQTPAHEVVQRTPNPRPCTSQVAYSSISMWSPLCSCHNPAFQQLPPCSPAPY